MPAASQSDTRCVTRWVTRLAATVDPDRSYRDERDWTMSWQLDGTYLESCNCNVVCPCTASGLTAAADNERCQVTLAFHVDTGQVDGVDVGDRSVVVFADAPQVMAEGDWQVGLYVDAAADDAQADALVRVFAGRAGGPMAALAPLIGEVLGVDRVPITFTDEGRRHAVTVGDAIYIEVEDQVAPQYGAHGPVVGLHWPQRALGTVRVVGVTVVTASRRTPYVGLVLVVAGAAWLWVLIGRGDMRAMPGSMGLGVGAFVGMWTVMMAAMMLPAAAPLIALYARSVSPPRLPRLGLFATGYVAVWAAAGLPAYALAVAAGWTAGQRPLVGSAVAATVFAANGVYQLSSWKDRCLAKCRGPVGLLLRYVSWRGPFHDLRAGMHHGAYCLGCCWTLMALLAAFGVMNPWAMVALTAVVAVEKLAPIGARFARLTGVVSLALAAAVFWFPWLAPGLHPGGMG
jgi:predicted metal-binding membrane protein